MTGLQKNTANNSLFLKKKKINFKNSGRTYNFSYQYLDSKGETINSSSMEMTKIIEQEINP